MAKRLFTIIFFLISLLFLVSTSGGFDSKLNRKGITNDASDLLDYIRENASKPLGQGGYFGGHDTITAEGMLLKEQVHQQIDSDGGLDFRNKMVREALPFLRTGAHDEDCTKIKQWVWVYPFTFPIPIEIPLSDPPIGPNGDGSFFDHFYNPDTGKGLKWGWLGKSAVERAQDYVNEIRTMTGCRPDVINNLHKKDKEKVYDYMGRILHLFQDMAVPSHTKDDIHVFTKPFEDYVNNHWDKIVNFQAFKEAVTVEEYLKGNYDVGKTFNPINFMKELAKFSHQYPNEEELYDIESGVNENGEIVITKVLNEERLINNVKKLIPEAIKYTAGYINAIYDALTGGDTGDDGNICKLTLPDPPNPGGDHPDDRFDVSDEFYWEKEFKLTEDDLTDLYMRTAIKKGKVGVWYKKRFMEIFVEGRTKYMDAPQEIKDRIEAEFQAMGQKLKERRDQAKSDWKGSPDVALFAYGFYNPSISLMLKFKEPVAFIGLDFDPSILKDHPVMLVPSGGFYGLENSEILKAKLSEYVKNGGTLIVFAQQHGYEFSVLPVPQEADGTYKTITAYGWTEDQSCQSNSSYIDTYHQILSGQSRATPSLNVDGYFSNYPSSSTVVLRRIANGQPAMIMYDYGLGKVIVTSMYSDWAYGHSQASKEEIVLVRDLFSWAKKPDQLPEIKPGETVSVSVTFTNYMPTDAASARLLIYDPDRSTLLSEETVNVSIPAGSSSQLVTQYPTLTTAPLGIYHIDYELYDSEGNIIQPQAETDSGRFVVSSPPSNPYKSPDFNFSIQSDAEYYLNRTPATFTVIAWNNTDVDHTITFRYRLPHLGPDGVYTIEVPAKSSTSFNIVVSEVKYQGWLLGTFHDESDKRVGFAAKGIFMVFPSIDVNALTDKTFYNKGETVIINTSLKNNIPVKWQSDVKISITDPENKEVFEDTKTVNFSPNGTATVATSFTLPANISIGTYTVKAVTKSGTMIVSSASTSFEFPQSQISVIPNLPDAFTTGTNVVPFTISNTGKINVYTGIIEINMKDPDGVLVYSGRHSFDIVAGESKALGVPISIPSLKFGNYTLIYAQFDETGTGSPTTITIPNTVTIGLDFDRPSYRIRETASLIVNLNNTGRFNLGDVSVMVSLPDTGFTNTQNFNLSPNQTSQLIYPIPIPETAMPGQHDVDLSLKLTTGSSIMQSSKLTVPESSLIIGYPGSTNLAAGDTISLEIQNIGGVDTNFVFYIELSNNDVSIYQNEINDGIQTGTTKTYIFKIPYQAVNGSHILYGKVSDTKTNKKTYFNKEINISGISAELSVKTSKNIYLSTEEITALSEIVNQTYSIDNANLHLQIVNKCAAEVHVESYHIFTWDGTSWVERGVLHYPETFETQNIDLSEYLPDVSGENKVRISNLSIYAYVDYIGLIADGVSYIPNSAIELTRNSDMLTYVTEADDYAANLRNLIAEIRWTDIPESTNRILSIRAMELGYNLSSCQEQLYWQTDVPITQAANTIVDLRHAVGQLSEKGQLYLQGILYSQTGQIIAYAEYPFSAIDGDIVLHFHADKPIYRPGEIVRITGEVMNLATVEAEGITLEIYEDLSALYTETFTIPANGSQTFSFTTTASSEGVYQLKGKTIQNNSTLIEISDRYEVASPNVSVSVSVPAIVGHEPLDINVEIKNEGKVEASAQLSVINNQGNTVDTQQITISAGETKLIQYTQQITGDTIYIFTFTGDIDQTITKTVLYGLAGSIAINPSSIYPEGKVVIPITITNTGQLDEALTVSFNLQPLALMQTKDYYIPKDRSVTDTLYFDLREGSYQLSAISQQPAVSSQANFEVKKDNKTDMGILIGAQSGELIPITVKLTNIGYNNIEGSVQLSAVSSQGQIVWNGSQNVSLSSSLTPIPYTFSFNINPSSIKQGNYTLKAELLNNGNQQLAVSNQPLTIKGPIFQITQFPSYQTFTVGQEGTFTFKVKNTGNQEGSFEFNFRAYDLIDSTQKEWLNPGEEKTVTFSFMFPADLEEKDYFADYELKDSRIQEVEGSRGQIRYCIAGINLNVNAYLDKQFYSVGDMARITIVVAQSSFGSLNLFARVNYNGYESRLPFTLSSTETLTFDIPLTEITGEKLFYGIYHESGRSIHLNSLYVHEAGNVITITTNKQVYNPADTVIITVSSQLSAVTGTLTLSAPDYEETSAFTGTATKSFVLPATMTAGTYYITYQLSGIIGDTYTGSYPFDVAGISVKVKDATLDKAKYASSDTLHLSLTIESNKNISANLKTWIVDPEGEYTVAGERNINLSSTDNLLVTHNSPLVTDVSGIHRLVYGIYTEDLLLVSGSEAFDVGDAILTGISTNKTDYPTNTEFVNVKVSMYGTVDAILELQLDGDTIRTQTIALNGFPTLNIELGTQEPGTHILKAMIIAGRLKSIKETTFTYALSLLDSDNDGMPDEWETAHGLDPNNLDANLDPDNDGLTNLQEYQHSTNPNNPDTDNDGMPDGWEVKHDLNPNVNDASSDRDNDGFSNLQEYQSGSNPSDPASIPNQPPIAKAGSDQNVITGTVVTLNGSESFDPEGTMITFLWTFIEVPAGSNITDASLSDATNPKPTFTPDVNGTYTLELIVSDGVLESAPAEVAIIVSTPNVAPNANAGADQNVSTCGTVYLDGSASNDPDNSPQPLSYLWTFDSIPGGSYLTNDHITNKDQVSASFIPDIDGYYVINLTVNDGELSSLDTVNIMATTPNVPPNANAGADITIYLGQTAILDGLASNDPDNGPLPLSYKWRFVAVPSGSQLNNEDITGAETVSPSFTPDVSGTYVIELMVSDGIDSAFDNVAVTVIKKATFCSILGNDPKPSILDQDIFKFSGSKGETVTVRLEANPSRVGSGKRATLLLAAKISGVLFIKMDRSELPNKISAKLPATGVYLITVAEQPKIAKGKRYRGAYCLSLEASQEIMQTLKPALWVE
jgi:hypothetical protein